MEETLTPYSVVDVAIASGQTVQTGYINKQFRLMAGFLLDEANTGATMTFTACMTAGGTYRAVRDSDGNVVSVATNSAGAIGISGAEADALAPWPFLRCISASAEGANRAFQVVLR
jgi:hypothetical protein